MKILGKTNLLAAASCAALAFAAVPAANAVVVVGGDNGWEVSFDGSVSGFYIYQDPQDLPNTAPIGTAMGLAAETLITSGAIDSGLLPGGLDGGEDDSRIRSGLLPAFFSFNVTSPTVRGLTGSARISFAPVIQNDNSKNNFARSEADVSGFNVGNQSGSSIDLREAYFNIDGTFGTLSIGRALALFQRQNYLTDMSQLGVGAAGDAGGQITLGHSGYGYLYPNYNARISYATPVIHGFQLEVGAFDPSSIGSIAGVAAGAFLGGGGGPFAFADETDSPRLEAEGTYATSWPGGRFLAFVSGLWQEADFGAQSLAPGLPDEVTSWGVAGGAQVGLDTPFGEVELTGSGYSGEALGTTLLLTEDALDPAGNERDHHGWLAQGTFKFNQGTKVGGSYGKSKADETSVERVCRGGVIPGVVCPAGRFGSYLEEQQAWTVGVYHDVTDWFTMVAEYSNVEREWFNDEDQDNDVFSVGGFFNW